MPFGRCVGTHLTQSLARAQMVLQIEAIVNGVILRKYAIGYQKVRRRKSFAIQRFNEHVGVFAVLGR